MPSPQQLIHDGPVTDYAELARLGQVSRARMKQIMNLLNLAPNIQEATLFLPRVEQGGGRVTERELREVVGGGGLGGAEADVVLISHMKLLRRT